MKGFKIENTLEEIKR